MSNIPNTKPFKLTSTPDPVLTKMVPAKPVSTDDQAINQEKQDNASMNNQALPAPQPDPVRAPYKNLR